MTIQDLFTQLRNTPNNIEFADVMQVIGQFYTYTPSNFTNATLLNPAGSNEGSCKIFYFALLHELTEAETLSLFGHYYRDDVLVNPTGTDHGNIRHFILTGWAGISFEGVVLNINK